MAAVKEGNGLVYVNGEFMRREEAQISVFDSGFLSGDGVFEGVRVYRGKIFKLDEHVELLYESAHALGMRLSFTKEQVRRAVLEAVRVNDVKDHGYVRIQITRGRMLKPFMDPALSSGKSSLVIYVLPGPAAFQGEGVEIISSSIRRIPPECLDQKIHSTNKLNSLLAKLQANLVGVADALMLDVDGFVAETSASNIFFVKDRKVLTPALKSCKMGVTRQLVIEGARELRHEVVEKDISLYEVFNADECFMCGTYGEIVPIVKIDGRKIGDGRPGRITEELRMWYAEKAAAEGVPVPA